MTTHKAEPYTGTRITIHSPHAFSTILSKLHSSIGPPSNITAWPELAKRITSYSPASRDQLVGEVEKLVGPHGFMIFQVINHGSWLPLFLSPPYLQSQRIILGNPLIALTMLKHDLKAGLSVPVELLVLEREEREGGGTDLVYQLPSGLIAPRIEGVERDGELVGAVEALDRKLGELVGWAAEG